MHAAIACTLTGRSWAPPHKRSGERNSRRPVWRTIEASGTRRRSSQVQLVRCRLGAASGPSTVASTDGKVVDVGAPTLVALRGGEAGSQGEEGVGGPALGCTCSSGPMQENEYADVSAAARTVRVGRLPRNNWPRPRRPAAVSVLPPSRASSPVSSPLLFLVRVVPTWRKVRVLVQRRPTPLSRSSRATRARRLDAFTIRGGDQTAERAGCVSLDGRARVLSLSRSRRPCTGGGTRRPWRRLSSARLALDAACCLAQVRNKSGAANGSEARCRVTLEREQDLKDSVDRHGRMDLPEREQDSARKTAKLVVRCVVTRVCRACV
ncbi:hypothetical protein MTO96_011736 [Rhipicephalus appendiculatus]